MCLLLTVVAVFVVSRYISPAVFYICFFFFCLEKYVWTYSDVMRAFPPGFQVMKVYIIWSVGLKKPEIRRS